MCSDTGNGAMREWRLIVVIIEERMIGIYFELSPLEVVDTILQQRQDMLSDLDS